MGEVTQISRRLKFEYIFVHTLIVAYTLLAVQIQVQVQCILAEISVT